MRDRSRSSSLWGVVFASGVLAAACSPPNAGSAEEKRDETFVERDALFDAHRIGESTIVAVGKFGNVSRSENGGETWERVPAGTNDDLYSVAFLDEARGVIVGANGTVLETTDGGRTWRPRKLSVETDLFHIAFRSKDEGYIIGSFGTVLRSDAGGKDWTPVEVDWGEILASVWEEIGPVLPHLYDLEFVGAAGWMVGEYGLVLRTEDGGRTWTRQAGGALADPHLFAIAVESERRAIAVGQSGFALSTEKAGAAWLSSFPTAASLYDVLLLPNLATAVAFGDLGTVLVSNRWGEPGSWAPLTDAGDIGKLPGFDPIQSRRWIGKTLAASAEVVLTFGRSGVGRIRLNGVSASAAWESRRRDG